MKQSGIAPLKKQAKEPNKNNLLYLDTNVPNHQVEFSWLIGINLFTVNCLDNHLHVHSAILKMDKHIEQIYCLKFCVADVTSISESLKLLQRVDGKTSLPKTRA